MLLSPPENGAPLSRLPGGRRGRGHRSPAKGWLGLGLPRGGGQELSQMRPPSFGSSALGLPLSVPEGCRSRLPWGWGAFARRASPAETKGSWSSVPCCGLALALQKPLPGGSSLPSKQPGRLSGSWHCPLALAPTHLPLGWPKGRCSGRARPSNARPPSSLCLWHTLHSAGPRLSSRGAQRRP